MFQNYFRREVLATPLFLLPLTGCSYLPSEDRKFGYVVINHTENEINGLLQVYSDGARLLEQVIELAGVNSDGSPSSTTTLTNLDTVSKGDDLTIKLTVDDNFTKSVDTTLDCDIEGEQTGDGVGFRIRSEYIESSTWCTTDELIETFSKLERDHTQPPMVSSNR